MNGWYRKTNWFLRIIVFATTNLSFYKTSNLTEDILLFIE